MTLPTSPHTDTPEDQPGLPIEVDQAIARLGLDRTIYMDILRQALPYLARQFSSLEQAMQLGDCAQIGNFAHAISSSAGNVGMVSTHRAARNLEDLANHQRKDALGPAFQTLQRALQQALHFGSTMLSNAPEA